MSKVLTLAIISLLLSGSVFAVTRTVKAGGGGDFTTIQACSTAMAGGDTCTVFAGTYNEHVTVSAGGVSAYKTFNVNGTDVVNVLDFTINSHVKIVGFHITNPSAPVGHDCVAWVNGSTDIFITSNTFYACGSHAMISGVNAADAASFVYIQGNTFSYACSTSSAPNVCKGLHLIGDHHLIENNDISHVSDGMDLAGSHNVYRKNTMHDTNVSDCGSNSSNCHIDFIESEPSTATQFNMFEGNTELNNVGADGHAFLSQGDVCAGQCFNLIVRFNTGVHVGSAGIIDDNAGSSVNPGFFKVKSYNNDWIDFNVSANGSGSGTNNFTHNSTNASQINDIFYYPQSLTNFNPYFTDASTVATFSVKNNLGWCTGATCDIHGKVYGSGNFTDDPGNVKANPQFLNYAINDFRLSPGSPAIGAGTSLTTAVGSGTSSTTLTVADAAYFQDGYGLVQADWIRIGTSTTVQISAVNYSTNVITLASPVSWTNGSAIYLYKDSSGGIQLSGSNPDMGSLQTLSGGGGPFTQTNNCPPTITPSSSCMVTVFFSPTVTGVQTASLGVASNVATSFTPLTGTGVLPSTLTLSPSTVNFGNVVVGATSAGSSITLANSGGVAASISSITASTHFTQTNNCGTSLNGGTSCTINATASPVTTGILNGTITVVSSATGSPFVANVSVNGVAPVAVLSPGSISFGNQATGSSSSPQSFTLSNTGTSTLNFAITKVGTNPGDFSVTTQCTNTLAPGINCPINVVFTPTTTGARSATVRVTDDAAGSPHDGAVSGTGIALTPAVCLSANTIAFGNQPVSTSSASKPVIVTNCGTANLVISAVNATGNFSSTGCVTTVLPNATCTINGTFSPLAAGNLTGQFSIVSNASSSPDLIALSGFGTQSGATLTSTAVFGHVVVGITSAPIPLTLTNTGNVSLGLNTPTLSGSNPGDFTFGNSCGATLAPQATCQISVTFVPTTAGARSATLNQSFTGGPTTVTSALSGTGDAATPAVTLTPTTFDFGSVTTGVTSASKTVQVQNSGNATLNITSITLTGANAADYALTNHCGLTLAVGSVCTADVTVTPSGTGARVANVHLIDDAADTPQNVTMTTNGVAAPAPRISLSPTSLAFSPPSIQTGTTSGAMNITATNTGNANLVVSSVVLGGSNPGDFILSSNCTTVAAGMNCAATVNCRPTVAGARTASVIFTSNAASSPDTATLSCTGFVGTPNIVIAVSSINFGNQTVGTTSGPAAFTLTNNGLATATGVTITASGDFAVTNNCGASITVGTTCSANVTFSPLILCGQFDPNNPVACLSNVHLGTVTVVSNTSNSPQIVSLQGTAIPAAPPPGPIIMGIGGNITIGGRLTVN